MIDYSLVDKWYNYSIPKRFDSTELLDFIIRSNLISRFVKEVELKFDAKSPSAYTDGEFCYLAGVFFKKDFYEKILFIHDEKEQIKACIAVNNGIQIHEALHIDILGNKNKLDMIKGHVRAEKYQTDAIFFDLLNIIEDSFSENYCFFENPRAYTFLESANGIFFNENVVNDRVFNVTDELNISNLLNILIIFRRRDLIKSSLPFDCNIQEFTDVLFRSLDTSLTLQQRVSIAVDLRELIEKNEELEQEAQKKKFAHDDLNIDQYEVMTDVIKEIRKIIYDNKHDLDSLSKFFQIETNENPKPIPVVYHDINEFNGHKQIVPQKEFANFANLLSHFRQEKNTTGKPKIIGNKFNPKRFHNFSVDGKVMTQDDSQKTKKGEPKIILLIDASGSMRGELLDKTVNVCYSVFDSLKTNHIPCAVYAHTTDYKNAIVVGVSSYQMPLSGKHIENTHNNLKRFQNIHGIDCSENADGWAIDFVSKRFPESIDDKFLIVLSDGQPSYGDFEYVGANGVNHTKEIVKSINKGGIYVVSMSLTEYVVETNNKIYGKDKNFKAYGSRLSEEIKKLIYKITYKGN